jgi:hypothetical protein
MAGRNGQRTRNGRSAGASAGFVYRREPKSAVVPYNTAPATAGAVAHITVIAQGDGLADRSGDKIFVERVNLMVNSISSASNNTRYVVFRDKFNLGTTPGVTDLLATAVVASPLSSLNVVQQKRFRILCDFVISGSVNGKTASTVRKTMIVNQPTYFTGAASTTKASGSLYLLVISDVAASSTHDVEMQIVYSDY